MIRQLRRRFVLANMLLAGLVLLAVFAALLAGNARQLARQSAAAMERALRWEGTPPPFTFSLPEDRPDADAASVVPSFRVTVDAGGRLLDGPSGGNISVDGDVLQNAVAAVLTAEEESGRLDELGLRFLKAPAETGLRIVFSDLGWERAAQLRIFLTALPVGLAALGLFFLVSLFLSRMALRPAELAWSRQRQFVADASHELKTPLTVVLANVGIVLARPQSTVESQGKWLNYIQEEAGRMKLLVEDLLFLAKHDNPRSRAPEAVNFSDVAGGCLLRFETVALERGVALEQQVEPGVTVQGVAADLDRLVASLLDNAVKYAGTGGRVSLRLTHAQEQAVLEVRNTGDPIPPEHLQRIFERFYRLDGSRSRGTGGYGLGLAIAQAIVTAHRGVIRAESSAQEGTVFQVLLPAAGRTRRRRNLKNVHSFF